MSWQDDVVVANGLCEKILRLMLVVLPDDHLGATEVCLRLASQ